LSLISYKADSCIRNSYYHNQCSECVGTCPENVFSVFQNRIKFEAEKCTYCLACLGTCPTEAIKIETFDPNREALLFQFSSENMLGCQNKTKCLSAFDSEHFSIMALQRESLEIDLSLCKDCHLSKMEKSIIERVETANTLLKNIKSEKEISLNFKEVEFPKTEDKRRLFNKILGKVEDKIAIDEVELQKIERQLLKNSRAKKMYPQKHEILIDILKESSNFESLESFQSETDILSSQKIDGSKCTNCGDCSQFCPTEAIFSATDKLSIYIHSDKCISCGICHHICKVGAVEIEKEISVIDFFRPKNLVTFEMSVCSECKTPVIKRGDQKICDRCIDFKTDYDHIFTLARDV
jgi:ferredoxin